MIELLLKSKKCRVLATAIVTMGLAALSVKFGFIDPAWGAKLGEYLMWGAGAFIGLQGVTDIASGGKTSGVYQHLEAQKEKPSLVAEAGPELVITPVKKNSCNYCGGKSMGKSNCVSCGARY